jgi:uncharacterized protein (DUF342 family)
VFAQTQKTCAPSQTSQYTGVTRKLQETLDRLSMEINKLHRQMSQCEQRIQALKRATITVKKKLYNGVELIVCDATRKITEEHVGGTFSLNNQGNVEFNP